MFQTQIEAGAKLLDEKVPGWESKIDLEKLNFSCGLDCTCIIGYSFPSMPYFKALEVLFGKNIDKTVLIQEMKDHGFSVENRKEWKDYPALTKEWISYIEDRRAQKVG